MAQKEIKTNAVILMKTCEIDGKDLDYVGIDLILPFGSEILETDRIPVKITNASDKAIFNRLAKRQLAKVQ